MTWTEGDVELDDVRLHYYRRGSGRPVVLAHGAGDSGLCWERVAGVLAADYEVIAYDARHHGFSDAPEAGPLGGGGPDLIALVQALGLQKPAIIGHSMGAGAVASAAAARPELFRCAILEDPGWRDLTPGTAIPPVPATDWQAMTLDEVIAAGKRQNPGWHEDEFPAWARSKLQYRPPRNTVPRLATDWRETAARITIPTLLVCGGNKERGRIVTAHTAEQAKKVCPSLEVVRFEQAGHNVRREAYDEFVAAVTAFLRQY